MRQQERGVHEVRRIAQFPPLQRGRVAAGRRELPGLVVVVRRHTLYAASRLNSCAGTHVLASSGNAQLPGRPASVITGL